MYDPLLRLYQASASGSAATRFLYDGQDMIGEYNAAGVLQKRYVHGPGIDEPLVEYDASGTRTWLHADERGSIIARSDDAGAKTAIDRYDFTAGLGLGAARQNITYDNMGTFLGLSDGASLGATILPMGPVGFDGRCSWSWNSSGTGQGGGGTEGGGGTVSPSFLPRLSADGFDRLLKTHYPNATGGGSSTTDYEQLGYDAASNVTSVRLRDGQVLSYGYDVLNRRVLDDNPGTTVAEADVAYTYDNLGTLTRAQDANGWYSAYAYDALGRTTAQDSSVSTTALGYDPVLRQKRQTWADGFYVVYDYDVSGQMTISGGASR